MLKTGGLQGGALFTASFAGLAFNYYMNLNTVVNHNVNANLFAFDVIDFGKNNAGLIVGDCSELVTFLKATRQIYPFGL